MYRREDKNFLNQQKCMNHWKIKKTNSNSSGSPPSNQTCGKRKKKLTKSSKKNRAIHQYRQHHQRKNEEDPPCGIKRGHSDSDLLPSNRNVITKKKCSKTSVSRSPMSNQMSTTSQVKIPHQMSNGNNGNINTYLSHWKLQKNNEKRAPQSPKKSRSQPSLFAVKPKPKVPEVSPRPVFQAPMKVARVPNEQFHSFNSTIKRGHSDSDLVRSNNNNHFTVVHSRHTASAPFAPTPPFSSYQQQNQQQQQQQNQHPMHQGQTIHHPPQFRNGSGNGNGSTVFQLTNLVNFHRQHHRQQYQQQQQHEQPTHRQNNIHNYRIDEDSKDSLLTSPNSAGALSPPDFSRFMEGVRRRKSLPEFQIRPELVTEVRKLENQFDDMDIDSMSIDEEPSTPTASHQMMNSSIKIQHLLN